MRRACEVVTGVDGTPLDDHLLVLCTVDAYGVLSLDLPGGKRRLAETAWEAAAREAAAAPGSRRRPRRGRAPPPPTPRSSGLSRGRSRTASRVQGLERPRIALAEA